MPRVHTNARRPPPKLLVIAALSPPGIFCAARGTKLAPRGTAAGSGSVRFSVGGTEPVNSAIVTNAASTAPAAPSKCPVAPLVDDTATQGASISHTHHVFAPLQAQTEVKHVLLFSLVVNETKQNTRRVQAAYTCGWCERTDAPPPPPRRPRT